MRGRLGVGTQVRDVAGTVERHGCLYGTLPLCLILPSPAVPACLLELCPFSNLQNLRKGQDSTSESVMLGLPREIHAGGTGSPVQ